MTICVALVPDQMLDDVAFAQREKNVQGPAPALCHGPKVQSCRCVSFALSISNLHGPTYRCTCPASCHRARPVPFALYRVPCACLFCSCVPAPSFVSRLPVRFLTPVAAQSQLRARSFAHAQRMDSCVTVAAPAAEPKEASVHSLPCEIKYTGLAPVNTYFKPHQAEPNGPVEAAFRGRELRGREVRLSDHQLSGWLLKDTVQGAHASLECAIAQRQAVHCIRVRT